MNDPAQATQPPAGKKRRRSRSAGPGSTMLAAGEPMVWLTGGALVMALAMIVGLLALVFWLGSTTFLVAPLVQVDLLDGTSQLGEVSREESVPLTTELIFREPPNIHKAIMAQLLGSDAKDSWQGLPAEVAAHAEGLRKEASEVAARLADVQRTLTALEAAQGPAPQSPAARAEWVRNNTRAEKLAATRQQVETLTARQEALTRQAATAEQTAAAIRQQASAEPLAAILALDEEAQTVVVDSLLRRQARQQGLPNVLARRRLLRTGNYDVTQTHFTWVADYQIKPEGESRPEWAVLVERQKEGNFYGVLDALVVRHPRTIQEDEELLSRQIQWLDEHAAAIKAPGQKDLFTQALAKLRGDRDKLRVERGAQFVQEFATPTTHQGTMSAVTASARQIPLEKFQADKLEADDPVVEVRESFIDPATAWQQFEVRHAEALTLRDAQDAAEHNAEGRKHQALEDARLACKEAELALSGKDADQLRLPILELAQRLAARDRAVADSKQQIENADQTLDALRKQYGPQSAPAQAALLVAAEVRASSERRLAKLSTEAAVAQRQLAAEPASAQRAVAVYLSAEQTAAAAPEFATGPHHSPKKTRVTYELRLKTAQKKPRSLPLEEIVRAIPANRLSARQSTQIYFSRWWEFLTAKPRNGNSEGGVFPAIFGTVVMTLLMSLAVVPFGVLAALYLREYAKPGPVVSLIRISINNLAGVPSIVFGVFGLGFFCYIVGAYIDGGPRQAQFTPLPLGRWITLATVAAVVCVLAFCAGLFGLAARRAEATRRQRFGRIAAGVLWIAATLLVVYLLATTPLFNGFFRAYAPNPKFGTGGLLWASLTLALLTLPVVIVATEEALSAVPNSMREGSYGCGASRWQTIRRVVLPQALPGIMTGMILAMARGAGEVAPLMLVGAVHTAPALPIDTTAPFVHAERSFMHLGYHIYYLGFQSQNSQAAMPMVFTTTLLLIGIVATLNITAMWLRARLRKRFQSGQF